MTLVVSLVNPLAEREGFEPSVPCGTRHFQCRAIDHSATSPFSRTEVSSKGGKGVKSMPRGTVPGVILPHLATTLAQLSLSVTVRLNTGFPGVLSLVSAQK